MKLKSVLLLCSVAALPQLAMAKQPSPEILGIAQAVADYCSRVDPKDAATFQAIWKNIAGLPGSQPTSAKGGSPDHEAYVQAMAYLSKISEQDAAAGCAFILGKGGAVTKPTSLRPDNDHRHTDDDYRHK